jgi:hypothetical protein
MIGAITLMLFIADSSNLILAPITKESLELFVKYQKIPLLILSLALPLGTVAAANFRALQFQRNLDRQEYEHQMDLYYKNREEFEKKVKGIVLGGGFRYFKDGHSVLVYSRFYDKPKAGSIYYATPSKTKLKKVHLTLNTFISTLKRLESYSLTILEEYKDDVLSYYKDFGVIKDNEKIPDVFYDLRILLLVRSIEQHRPDLSNYTGLHSEPENANIREYIDSICEMAIVFKTLFGHEIKNNTLGATFADLKNKVRIWLTSSSFSSETTLQLVDFEKKYQLTLRD